MTVKELIKALRAFDGDTAVRMEAEYDCGHGIAGWTDIRVFKEDGHCIIRCEE